MDCLFCKIINGDIPSKKVYEDDHVYAFHDISPMAPVHILIIPKKHIPSVMGITAEDKDLIGHLHLAIQHIAKEMNLDEEGFRVITNTGKNGQQTVFHLHYHIVGGRQLEWNM
ncbi:histidine triad nucleotide-binding protein [Brevibacillus daliensis]|uniref:histidine triad nucleotide-binding protein n=1 Tax=Brevibacillus daliensis TaxID=2892995 RepID=UPI001E3B4C1B|nr:histidine triad nucleotide-binding protein [Brevibacillus daliensis]